MKGPTVALVSMLAGIAVATLSHHAERTPASAWARPALRQISTSDVSFIHTPAGHQSCLERGVFGDPSESQYALPYPVGRTYQVLQSCCSTTPGRSHYGLLAYDFTMEMGSEVVAARDGVVWIVQELRGTGPASSQAREHQVVEPTAVVTLLQAVGGLRWIATRPRLGPACMSWNPEIENLTPLMPSAC